MPAIGGSYFREHLPPLVLTQKNLQSGFTSGDKVIVELTRKHIEEFSSEHGKWNVDMAIVGVRFLCFSHSLLLIDWTVAYVSFIGLFGRGRLKGSFLLSVCPWCLKWKA